MKSVIVERGFWGGEEKSGAGATGLYLCGSGTWPGGTVSGIPGHNAAQTILSHIK